MNDIREIPPRLPELATSAPLGTMSHPTGSEPPTAASVSHTVSASAEYAPRTATFAAHPSTYLALRRIHDDHENIAGLNSAATESGSRTAESTHSLTVTCSLRGVSTTDANPSVTPATALDGTGAR